ncbi:uncharacterized protein LOC129741944 [Uranotaenia lowii]|uniref:uncharacterized protein LOC129741944 n=1 Tax=Uranotaenia lowii TaxID=190385 RepID=UPI00247AC695|nr:uncharacterized protein LOC129741944 [Uranotaenia lowii]
MFSSKMAQIDPSKYLCRICSNPSANVITLDYTINGISLAEMLQFCVMITVNKNDNLPYQCCYDCKTDLLVAHKMVKRCIESDKKFRQHSQESDENSTAEPSQYAQEYIVPEAQNFVELPAETSHNTSTNVVRHSILILN